MEQTSIVQHKRYAPCFGQCACLVCEFARWNNLDTATEEGSHTWVPKSTTQDGVCWVELQSRQGGDSLLLDACWSHAQRNVPQGQLTGLCAVDREVSIFWHKVEAAWSLFDEAASMTSFLMEVMDQNLG